VARIPSFAKSALTVGEGGRVVSWCDDGVLAAEYGLFEPSDFVVRASAPRVGLEGGYRTTARKALEHLTRSGVTPAVADDVVRAIPREVVSALVRCQAAVAVANRLGAAEILDGARYSTESRRYRGAWLDLEELAVALSLPAVPALLQALFLASALAELPGATEVLLSTSAALRKKRPSERSYVRPAMPSVDALLQSLAKLQPADVRGVLRDDPTREERLRTALSARIRERRIDELSPAMRHHLDALETAFAEATTEPFERPAAPSTAIVVHTSSLPSLDRLGGIVSADVPQRRGPYVAEVVESLQLPEGTEEADLGDYDFPTTPLQVRVAMTRLARALGRDYRVRHGQVLKCDVLAIDVMQKHLLRWVGASLHDREVAWQLRRHGALLSEIFARVLGGAWVDVANREAAYWMMQVRGDVCTRPIGCIFQFVAAGNRAGDLVGQFLELERLGRTRPENLAQLPRA
jgi:hypothetical protein